MARSTSADVGGSAQHEVERLAPRAAPDPQRPAYHPTAPSGRMLPPTGLVWADGAYHLFYHHVPPGAKATIVHTEHPSETECGAVVDESGRVTLGGGIHTPAGDQWDGCLSLPRIVALRDTGMRSCPVPELWS